MIPFHSQEAKRGRFDSEQIGILQILFLESIDPKKIILPSIVSTKFCKQCFILTYRFNSKPTKTSLEWIKFDDRIIYVAKTLT
jgi:hypothetical protein